MRLILSRKGFDSAAGGVPSPILPDGRLCPLPIPDPRSPYHYDNLQIAGQPLARLLADLRPNRLPAITYAHLDPDLDAGSMSRPDGWRPLFGQLGAAQSHLGNQGVGIGDLFLFYGWFREVEQVNGRYRYKTNSPDRHVIYGWLQVGNIWPVAELAHVPEWARGQVHFQRQGEKKANEVVYCSTERLKLAGSFLDMPGGGLLEMFRQSLCLTAEGHSRSQWELPDWFMPEKGKRPLSYHRDLTRWQKSGEKVRLRTAMRGQEFVLQGEDYPKMAEWVGDILTGMIHSEG